MKIPILMYHRVSASARPDRYTVSAAAFEKQMMLLRDSGCQVVSLTDVLGRLNASPADSTKSVCITFDDGFKETRDFAAPVLGRLGFTATFFLVSGLVGGVSSWDRTKPEAGEYALMNWSEAKELSTSGFEIGSHSVTHPALPELTEDQAAHEISASKQALEAKLGVEIRHFAYPYGRFDACIRNLVGVAGYRTACSTLSGFATPENDPLSLRRIEIFGSDAPRMFRRKLLFGANEMSAGAVLRYYVQRGVSRVVGAGR